jgi:hypothetical protein
MHIENKLIAIEKQIELLFVQLRISEKLTQIAAKLDELQQQFSTGMTPQDVIAVASRISQAADKIAGIGDEPAS